MIVRIYLWVQTKTRKMNERVLIIIRGIPGCGKSSFAKLFGTSNVCTADDYFMKDGEYKWDPSKIKFAHEWCQSKAKSMMDVYEPLIIVANTSTTERELKPYYDLAEKYGYKVYSVIVENRHEGKNIHNVPEATLEAMKTRFQIKL